MNHRVVVAGTEAVAGRQVLVDELRGANILLIIQDGLPELLETGEVELELFASLLGLVYEREMDVIKLIACNRDERSGGLRCQSQKLTEDVGGIGTFGDGFLGHAKEDPHLADIVVRGDFSQSEEQNVPL